MTLVLLLATSILVVIPGEVDATVPGGIGRIAFTDDTFDMNGDIFVRDFAGSTPIRLTNHVGGGRPMARGLPLLDSLLGPTYG